MQDRTPNTGTIAKATKWSFFTQIVAKIIPPITSMILARIFSPEVFGIIATITMVTSFADTFSESGFQKYLIRKKYENPDEFRKDADVAYWTNLVISIFLWGIISYFSSDICGVLGNPGVEKALVLACAQLPITSISSIQVAVYYRRYDFKHIFKVQLAASISNMVITLCCAFLKLGYWAIIIGTLSGCLITAILLTIKSSWHPHLYYDIKRVIKIISFSIWIMAEGLAVWLTSWFDSFIVGNRLNPHDLGIYKNSQSVVNGILAIPQNSVTNVLFVTLSKLQGNNDEYNKAFLLAQRMLGYILMPMATGLLVFRKLAVRIAFGSGWEDAELVIAIWALASVLRILFVSINTAVFISKGKPRLSLICQLIDIVFLVPTCLLGIRYGFVKFVIIRGIVRLDIIIPNLIILSKVFGIRFRMIVRNMSKPVVSTAIMTVLAVYLNTIATSIIGGLCSIALCILAYLAINYVIAKDDVVTLIKMIKSR